jgi:hypothetical protein
MSEPFTVCECGHFARVHKGAGACLAPIGCNCVAFSALKSNKKFKAALGAARGMKGALKRATRKARKSGVRKAKKVSR